MASTDRLYLHKNQRKHPKCNACLKLAMKGQFERHVRSVENDLMSSESPSQARGHHFRRSLKSRKDEYTRLH